MTGERYVRTTRGAVVHRASCPYAHRSIHKTPWNWADDKTPSDIVTETAAVGLRYHWCAHCFTLQEQWEGGG